MSLVLHTLTAKVKKENQRIRKCISIRKAMIIKARNIAFLSTLKIELADVVRGEAN